MSTLTSLGAPMLLYGPLPKPRPHNLLSLAERVTRDRAAAGFSVGGYPEDVPSGFDPCTEGTFREKDDGGDVPYGTFLPFDAYLTVDCSSLGIGDWEEFKNRANRVLEVTLSFAAEEQLAKGTTLGITSGVPFFGDTNLVALTASTPQPALSLLEQAIGETGREGWIHAPAPVVSAWSFDGALTVVDGVLQTWLGTPVVVGDGYLGTDPVSQASPTANQTSWAFATGPVMVYIGEMREIPEDIREALDTSNNDVVYRAERELVVGWDTALQTGVLVDWTP